MVMADITIIAEQMLDNIKIGLIEGDAKTKAFLRNLLHKKEENVTYDDKKKLLAVVEDSRGQIGFIKHLLEEALK